MPALFLAPLAIGQQAYVMACCRSCVWPCVRPSIHPSTIFLLTLLTSTNINQSAPTLVKMFMTIRSRMSSIMELIGPDLSELSALEVENLPYLTVYTLASANIDQSVPNLATIYMPIRSWMSSIIYKY